VLEAVDFVVLILATNQVIETFHHGSIFASLRARAELGGGRLAELLVCMFCLSHWAALALVGWFFVSLVWIEDLGWFALATWPVYGFAITRAAQILNDLVRPYSRTPRPDLGDFDFEGDPDG
jgi:hypothetical protein